MALILLGALVLLWHYIVAGGDVVFPGRQPDVSTNSTAAPEGTHVAATLREVVEKTDAATLAGRTRVDLDGKVDWVLRVW